jgi:hypothetical protein
VKKQEPNKKLLKQFAKQLAMEFIDAQPARRGGPPKPRAPKPEAVKAAPDRAERKPIKISPEVLARSRQKAERYRTSVNPFKLPTFPTAVLDHVPADSRIAADEALGQVSSWAGGAWGALSNHVAFEGVGFLGYPYLSELAQRPEYRVIVETIATEMTRKWIRIQAKGDKDKAKKIDQLKAELDRLKVREVFCKACEVDGYFGRAHIYLDTGATDDRDELATPIGNGGNRISEKKFQKGDLKRLAVVEPIWTYPANYDAFDPLKPDWYRPQRWYVMSKQVHVSRLLTFVGREVPDLLKPCYSFGGLALTQMAKPYVENFLNIRQSVADIIQAFTVFVLHTNLGETAVKNSSAVPISLTTHATIAG